LKRKEDIDEDVREEGERGQGGKDEGTEKAVTM
jgi:hypothetical protein